MKSIYPNAEFGYVGNKRTAPILQDYEKIDRVFTYERDEYNDLYKKSKIAFIKKTFSFLKEIKNQNYDVVFDFSLNSSINFLTFLIGIKDRIGLNYKNRGLFLTKKIKFDGFEHHHVAQYYLDILGDLGYSAEPRGLEITIQDQDLAWVDQFLVENQRKPEKLLVGILPGAGASWGKEAKYRRWDAMNYAKLVDKMVEKYNVQIILMGDKSEQDICQEVRNAVSHPFIDAVGRTDICQLAALLSRCHLVILNDGGPLHLAVAAKVKTVSIFGPVDYNVYGPFGSKKDHLVVSKDLACQPCYRRFRMTSCEHVSCLKLIEPEDVLDKIADII